MSEIKEYSIAEASKMEKRFFYFNVYGWNTYLTLEPTFATPTGKLWNAGFPKVVRIHDGKIFPTNRQKI